MSDKKRACEVCGAHGPKVQFAKVDLGYREVLVCGKNRRATYEPRAPKKACLSKLLVEESEVCRLCGEDKEYAKRADAYCKSCELKLERLKRLEKKDLEENLVMVTIGLDEAYWKVRHRELDFDHRKKMCESLLVMMSGDEDAVFRREDLPREEQGGIETLKANKTPKDRHWNYFGDPVTKAKMRQVQAAAFVVDNIYLMVQAAYRSGHEDGRSLITGLASGDLTLNEVNEKSTKASKW